jgi:hypothetical protein
LETRTEAEAESNLLAVIVGMNSVDISAEAHKCVWTIKKQGTVGQQALRTLFEGR